MSKESAGILVYRFRGETLEVFLVHPGGPFWLHRDLGAWSIPKGIPENTEDLLAAAKREFEEETGLKLAEGNFIRLSPVVSGSGKTIHAWATEGDYDARSVTSNTFPLEWPPKSGKRCEFPEVDRAAWYSIEEAEKKLNAAQVPLVLELEAILFPKKSGSNP
jgi:predicted NUDIX family NTP pyrophosphohydrolase